MINPQVFKRMIRIKNCQKNYSLLKDEILRKTSLISVNNPLRKLRIYLNKN